MASPQATSLMFKVYRCEPELITPAKLTPHEFKPLSDIDDQETLRFQVPFVHFYPYNPSMQGKDPVNVIREALAKTLVFYYPFAGRLREGPNRKLIVECTGEGIMFIEADADVTLEQFGDALQPPFPCLDELLFDVPASNGIVNCPLLLIQVTRLKCGGFIFGIRFNHTMCDALGLVQFMSAISEIAHGAHYPSILPVWEKHMLNARNPARVTCRHPEYDQIVDNNGTIVPPDNMVNRSFFISTTQVSAIRRRLPVHFSRSSTFEVLTACLWKCRTIALQPNPTEEMHMICIVNTRNRSNPPLPVGFYGNALAFPAAVTTAEMLQKGPLEYALWLLKIAKAKVTEEYVQSTADLLVTKGRPHLMTVRSWVTSDLTRVGLRDVDFGWGKAVYAGPGKLGMEVVPGLTSFYVAYKNKKGEEGIVIPICLPEHAMDRFEGEFNRMLTNTITEEEEDIKSTSICSRM